MSSTLSLLRTKLLSPAARSSARIWAGSVAPRALQPFSALRVAPKGISSSNNAAAARYMSSQTLSEILARELAEEEEDGRADKPEELVELQSKIEQDWTIVDDGAMTRLIRKSGSNKVVVAFHCQDTVEEQDLGYEEGAEEEELAVPFQFKVLVSKAGKTLVLNCISNAGETVVDGAAMTTEDVEVLQADGIGTNQYQGPEFPELAEDLQEAFHGLVDELGVNEDVSAFVSMYADFKEQQEYVQFLKDVHKVL